MKNQKSKAAEAAATKKRRAQVKKFEKAARPLIKYLCENHHPHVAVIVTPTNAELLEGKMSTGHIFDYLRD